MCLFDEIKPPTAEGVKMVSRLKILFFAHVILVTLKVVLYSFERIFEILLSFLLYVAFTRIYFNACVLYILLVSMQWFMAFLEIATRTQNSTLFVDVHPLLGKLHPLFCLVCLVFYSVAFAVAFYAYREFKAIAQENPDLRPGFFFQPSNHIVHLMLLILIPK